MVPPVRPIRLNINSGVSETRPACSTCYERMAHVILDPPEELFMRYLQPSS